MKKLIVVAAAVLATSAQASSGLDFGDLNYFLKSGQFNLTSNANVLDAEVTDESSSRDFEKRGFIFDNRFGYGLADNFNAFVGLDYALKYQTQISGSSDSDNSGLSNPYAGVNYRLMSQKDSSFNLDFGAVARFSVMDAEVGTFGKDGTYNRGNHSLELNSSIGYKWNEANEWRLTAAIVHNFDGEYEDTSAKEDVETDASQDISLTAAYQYRPVQEFMMAVALQATQVGEVDSEDDSNDKYTDDSHLDFVFTFTAKYLITETFIAKFNYGESRLAEYDRSTNGTDSEQKNRFQSIFGLGVDWLF